jgi:hypothetical protein
MAYTRLYADESGESHFTEVEIDLALVDYIAQGPRLELSPNTPASGVRFMNAPPGWESEWHPSSTRNLFFVLTGEWEVTASDGESKRFGAGAALLVEDTTGKGHASRVVSEIDSLAAMIQLD